VIQVRRPLFVQPFALHFPSIGETTIVCKRSTTQVRMIKHGTSYDAMKAR
jgi:hypothetical protein